MPKVRVRCLSLMRISKRLKNTGFSNSWWTVVASLTRWCWRNCSLNVRALIEAEPDKADLVDLCQDVLFHDNMKAFGLNQLVKLYVNWQETHLEIEQANVLAE